MYKRQLPGTPVTFQYYTRRPMGMVGGFAQTSLFAAFMAAAVAKQEEEPQITQISETEEG